MHADDQLADITRSSVRRWVRTVMTREKWSAEEWARRASTTATNITRILGSDEYSLPNTSTLARLARVAGDQPDFVGHHHAAATMNEPLLDHAQITSFMKIPAAERQRYLATIRQEYPSLLALMRSHPTSYAATLETDTLRGRGMVKGDILVIEPGELGSSDAGAYAACLHKGKIAAYLWFPPLLVPAHETESPIAIKEARLLGRIKKLIRTL